jgi:hypothetical protein
MGVEVMDEELGDEQLDLIALLLPKHKRRGRPRAEDRRTLNSILWVLRSRVLGWMIFELVHRVASAAG